MRLTRVDSVVDSDTVPLVALFTVTNCSSSIRRRLMSRSFFVMLMFVVALQGGGCSTTPRLAVSVDGIDSGQAVQDVSYVLKPVVKGVDTSNLHFIAYSKHIDRALQNRGMIKATSVELANTEILVNYGHERLQRPIRRYSLMDEALLREPRCGRWHRGRCLRWHRFDRYDRYGWGYDRPGYNVAVVTSHRVFIALEARLKGAGKNQSALWATRARATFAKPDLRVTLPLLLAAAEEYIGVDTGHERTVVLSGEQLNIDLEVE